MIVLQDYFEPEPYILAQIETLKPEYFSHVSPALNLEQALAHPGPFPAAFLMFSNHAIIKSTYRLLQEQQTWIVAVVAKDVSDTNFNTAVRSTAGPLLYQIDRVLHTFGFQSEAGEASTLKAVSPPEQFINAPGIGVFTRAFQLEFVNSSS